MVTGAGHGYVDFNADPYSAHQRILALSGNPRTVLDIGGSSGDIAAALVARGAHAIVVDSDADAIASARSRGLEAYVVDLLVDDLRTSGPLQLADSSVDLIILADVLEHFADPAALLRRIRPLLEPKGRLIASVPNGANWALRLSLLAGRWDYTERGLLDATHLRNFTRKSFYSVIRDGGFDIDVKDLTCPIPVARGGRLSALAHGVARVRPGLLAYQHLVAAHPTASA